jgi:hypothetical protein
MAVESAGLVDLEAVVTVEELRPLAQQIRAAVAAQVQPMPLAVAES